MSLIECQTDIDGRPQAYADDVLTTNAETFQDLNGHRVEAKVPVHAVLRGAHIECADEIARRLKTSEDKLLIMLEDMARMYEDRSFIRELLYLNYAVDPFEQAKPLVD